MEAIGFKNFRRFKEMEPITLGGVNIFVGGNNAGKSTVVKGLLLLLDFLKNSKTSFNELPKFRFDGPESHDVNIDTFRRALCWDANEQEIVFKATLYGMNIEVCIFSPQDVKKEDVAYADVKYFKLTDSINDITIDYQFTEADENYGVTVTTSKRIYSISYQKDFCSEGLPDIVNYLSGLTSPPYSSISLADKNEKIARDEMLNLYGDKLNEIKDRFTRAISRIHLEYIYSHDASQKVLYNKKDENDYVSRSIHEFYNQRIISKSRLGKDVVCRWMKRLCNIEDYRITNIQGEAYQFEVKTDGKWANLADMGRGAIQIVSLLVRIASIIKKYERDNFLRNMNIEPERPIVLVEEPEQNMHPALQSQLAEMFYDIYDRYGIRFIIETHSEYLVRRSQVIVMEEIKGKKFSVENNPFNVYFFDSEEGPYKMIYRDNGRFSNEFKSSFYDEASNLAFKLF